MRARSLSKNSPSTARSRFGILRGMESEKKFRDWDVNQSWLLPPSVLDFVPGDHLAHFVRDTVRESLDCSEVLEVYQSKDGRPPFHPVMMVALLLYAYSNGVYSSRRIAKACETRVDFMAVTAMNKPDFRTIALFRKRHLKALSRLFVQVLKLCRRAGLVKLGHVALDGSKFRANASKHSAMSYGRMKKAEPELAAEVKGWFDSAEGTDTDEDQRHGETGRGNKLPGWVKSKQARLEKIREAMKELEEEAKAEQERKEKHPPKYRGGRKTKNPPGVPKDSSQRNFTDPDSRIMKTNDGFQQCYNAQIAVDAEHQVIVSNTLTSGAADAPQLTPLVRDIKENTSKQADEISADAGYCSEENLKELSRRRIRGYVATTTQRKALENTGKENKHGPRACAMRRRLRQGGRRSRYRLRKQTVEPVFGQIKEARGFRRFLLRGLESVRDEFELLCTAHNLLKLFVGVRG